MAEASGTGTRLAWAGVAVVVVAAVIQTTPDAVRLFCELQGCGGASTTGPSVNGQVTGEDETAFHANADESVQSKIPPDVSLRRPTSAFREDNRETGSLQNDLSTPEIGSGEWMPLETFGNRETLTVCDGIRLRAILQPPDRVRLQRIDKGGEVSAELHVPVSLEGGCELRVERIGAPLFEKDVTAALSHRMGVHQR